MFHYFFHAHHPPRVEFDSDFDWVLRVAFGTSGGGSAPASGDGAWRWAQQLGLQACVAAALRNNSSFGLRGPEAMRVMKSTDEAAQSTSEARREVLECLERAANSSGVEVVLLRRAALQGNERAWENSTDIDVLVREGDDSRLVLALVREGCSTERRQVPWSARQGGGFVISGRAGGALVLRRHLPFLRMVPGGVFIDWDCLKRCGQLFRDDVTPKNLWLPSKSVQAADIVAQLLVEQRFAPEFPAFQALLVAQALGLGRDEDLAFDAFLLLQTDVEHAEFEALRELLRAFGDGTLAGISKRARTLLEHFVAAATVPRYRAKLNLQRKAQVWQHERHLERAAERVGRMLARLTRR